MTGAYEQALAAYTEAMRLKRIAVSGERTRAYKRLMDAATNCLRAELADKREKGE